MGLVRSLGLQPHPEGGFYRETYRSDEDIPSEGLPGRFTGGRSFSTAIYYLLGAGDYSAFHRIRSDEVWHFYTGSALAIHTLVEGGVYERVLLGTAADRGEVFQTVVRAGRWFACEPTTPGGFCLAGCTVAPGFDFADFEMADAEELKATWPGQRALIERLCR